MSRWFPAQAYTSTSFLSAQFGAKGTETYLMKSAGGSGDLFSFSSFCSQTYLFTVCCSPIDTQTRCTSGGMERSRAKNTVPPMYIGRRAVYLNLNWKLIRRCYTASSPHGPYSGRVSGNPSLPVGAEDPPLLFHSRLISEFPQRNPPHL